MDLRQYKTKTSIKQAFFELLSERDFAKITVANILERSMVGRTTFYRYYLDKYDLVEQLIAEISYNYEQTLHLHLETEDKNITGLLDNLREETRELLLLRRIANKELEIDSMLKNHLMTIFQNTFVDRVKINRPEISVNLLSALVLELLICQEKGIFQGEESEIDEIFDDLSQLLQLLRNN
ncbi:TetR/AcrR family transcriptional regulator [Streptococcus loxodontisalivarius]|uniref:AcrR family transcriptional regulator n=1 Tax=Streptococcus loxodontisalivarius TaxID=1349415 RepID=A0ABS2PQC6_9STRE|nr:TetR family transcriptional regulator [Streptococcus loxodontisalivarius]MBM7642256.1 AcrR family transcriptional regulator [Streptococcus loxodontisalivarius]